MYIYILQILCIYIYIYYYINLIKKYNFDGNKNVIYIYIV